jgi:hypothetical protein
MTTKSKLEIQLERLITYLEVELEAPNKAGQSDLDEMYDDGFDDAYKDILGKLNYAIYVGVYKDDS